MGNIIYSICIENIKENIFDNITNSEIKEIFNKFIDNKEIFNNIYNREFEISKILYRLLHSDIKFNKLILNKLNILYNNLFGKDFLKVINKRTKAVNTIRLSTLNKFLSVKYCLTTSEQYRNSNKIELFKNIMTKIANE